MRLLLLAAANRQPAWVADGFDEYARRLRGSCPLEIREIRLGQRGSGANAGRAIEQEGEKLLAAVPAGARVVALDERGSEWTTLELARRFDTWMASGAPVCFLIGGPDGLAEPCLARADERWSLSQLTLPHGLVRVLAAEALYRAWSVLNHHPYHRE